MVDNRERSIVRSALWAAGGDALGWITELARDGTVEARSGVDYVTEPIDWRRYIGGRSGVRVFLPAGTYSDDTQLRLAVCRAIRGNGVFDAEAFARVELTVWPSYALGAGRGTKAAAQNLSKRGVNWFSNFFEKGSEYVTAGGNGAAMRVQPHVWVASAERQIEMHTAVLSDALITHGHPHGFAGAYLHALFLADAINGNLSAPTKFYDFVDAFADIPDRIEANRELAAFWRPAWEQATGISLTKALSSVAAEISKDLDSIMPLLESGDPLQYVEILERLGCLSDRYRGSGLKTAVAASALAHLYQDDVEGALVAAANVTASDTDTIATMAGAIMGACTRAEFRWAVQDREYIVSEASRLAKISAGSQQDSFAYPDLARWQPPQNQSDAIGIFNDRLALVGLGEVGPVGEEYVTDDSVWQWMRLNFGQTILVKRRTKIRTLVEASSMPAGRQAARVAKIAPNDGLTSRRNQLSIEKRKSADISPKEGQSSHEMSLFKNGSFIDKITEEVIGSNFDDNVTGKMFNACIDHFKSIEAATSFAAIIAKAKLNSNRRRAK
ncbi:ADP-ribosylglycohydrolase family protein [Mesorhizobium sp. M0243]|uniref:ADP-ribosylglycohydrolase family protein n=1 Tax=Mesorhizobium sp. M0243 TaxID=2956925 RepID=UPI0033375F38